MDNPDISPPNPVELMVLNEQQAGLISGVLQLIDETNELLQNHRDVLNGLLLMVKPEGSTAFNTSTMTFYKE